MDKIVVVVLTKDSPEQLVRLLQSINNNYLIGKLPILVIDDSAHKTNRDKNLQIINRWSRLTVRRVTNSEWSEVKAKWNKYEFLDVMTLGQRDFNTYNTMNIGVLMVKLIYPSAGHVLWLDGDMVVPADFKLPATSGLDLVGIPVRGSPDFSRLQWLYLYVSLVTKNKYVGRDYYTKHFFDTVRKSDLRLLLEEYTDLIALESHRYSGDVLQIKFPVRLVNTNSMITSIKVCRRAPFPPWWGQQFAWYGYVKPGQDKQMHKYLIHAAKRKKILDPIMQYEETGSMLSWMVAKRNMTLSQIENANLADIENLTRARQVVESSKIWNRVEIMDKLDQLIEEHQKIDLTEMLKQVEVFKTNINNWQLIWDRPSY